MPNDVPDWTGLNQVNLVGSLSGTPLGDSAAAVLANDSATLSASIHPGTSTAATAALLSLKPAAGQVIALRGVPGALTVGVDQSVTPTYGQAPAAGNCLVCLVSNGGNAPTTASPGWTLRSTSGSTPAGAVAIFVKPNSAGADAAPTITCVNPGGTPMVALLIELTGADTSAPQENSGSAISGTDAVAVTATAKDAAFGDAVVAVGRWALSGPSAVSFSEVFNNGAPAVHLGGAELDIVASRAHDFALGIIPPATIPAPVGMAAWDYDVQAVSAPAAGTVAQVTLAASATKIYRCARLAVSLSSTTAASHVPVAVLNDGSTTIWTAVMASAASIGSAEAIDTSNLAHKGTLNQNMLLGFNGNSAGGLQAASIGAYLR